MSFKVIKQVSFQEYTIIEKIPSTKARIKRGSSDVSKSSDFSQKGLKQYNSFTTVNAHAKPILKLCKGKKIKRTVSDIGFKARKVIFKDPEVQVKETKSFLEYNRSKTDYTKIKPGSSGGTNDRADCNCACIVF